MHMNGRSSFVAVTGLIVISALLAATPATESETRDQPPALSAGITVHLDPSVISPLAIKASDVEDALGTFYKSHDTFTLEEFQALEVTGERGTKLPLSKISKIKVTFER